MAEIYYNVHNLVFGAQGNGVADDRVAIQKAIDMASAAGGGTVYVPPGVYLCGKDGANPYSLILDADDNVMLLGCGRGSVLKQSGSAGAGAFDLIRVEGNSEAFHAELLSFDQSGLTNPGAAVCHVVNVRAARIVKLIGCVFTGGVATAGAYVHIGGLVDFDVSLLWIAECEMRDAGGPCIWIDGNVSKVWIVDSSIVETLAGETDTIRIVDTLNSPIQDIKILNCHVENASKFAIRCSSTDVLDRIQIGMNTLLGWVSCTGLSKSQIQGNQVIVNVAAIADPAILVANGTHVQVQKNVVHRTSTCAVGYNCKISTCTRVMVQKNDWMQDVPSSPLLHIVDSTVVQVGGNVTRAADAGAATVDAYRFEAAAAALDNIMCVGDQISAVTGSYLRAIQVVSSGLTIGNVQIIPGIFKSCNVGVRFDEGGGGIGRFTAAAHGLMCAGGMLDASVAAWQVSIAAVPIHIGFNASPFGANAIAGNGSPHGVYTKPAGSTYQQLDPSGGSALWVKEVGGNTNWVGK